MGIHTYGTNAVDWEQRLDFDRLRTERLARLRAELERSSLGAVLAFDFANIRYMTATHIGTWAMDKLIRFSLLVRGGEPDHLGLRLGGEAPPALQPVARPRGARVARRRPRPAPRRERQRGGPADRRPGGDLHPARRLPSAGGHRRGGRPQDQARAGDPRPARTSRSGSTSSSCRSSPRCSRPASRSSTASRCSSRPAGSRPGTRSACSPRRRRWSTPRTRSLYEFLRPGVRENECVGLVSKTLYDLGSEYVEGVNAISGERCAPHPHVYSDRIIRPGDPAFFDILHSYKGYRTCYYRTFAVGSASPAQRDAYTDLPRVHGPGDRPGQAGRDDRRHRRGLAHRAGVRLRRRGGRLRPAVRPRRRAVDLGEADLQPAGLARPPRGARGGHGLRPGDLLARRRRLVGGADRGGAGRHRRRLRGDHQVPGRGAAGGRAALLHDRAAPLSTDPRRASPTSTPPRGSKERADDPAPRDASLRRARDRPAAAATRPPSTAPTCRCRPGCGCSGCCRSCASSRSAPTTCSCSSWSRARPTCRWAWRRSPPASAPRCARTTTRSPPTAGTPTRWPAASRWRACSPSCSAGPTACSAGRAARCT